MQSLIDSIKQRFIIQQQLNQQIFSYQNQKYISRTDIFTKIVNYQDIQKIRQFKEDKILAKLSVQLIHPKEITQLYQLCKQIMFKSKNDLPMIQGKNIEQLLQQLNNMVQKQKYRKNIDSPKKKQRLNKVRSELNILLPKLTRQLTEYCRFEHLNFLKNSNQILLKNKTIKKHNPIQKFNIHFLKNNYQTQNKSINKVQSQNQKQSRYTSFNNSGNYQPQKFSTVNKQIYYRSVYNELKEIYANLTQVISDLDHDFLKPYYKKIQKHHVLENIHKLISNIIKYDQTKIKNSIDNYSHHYPKKLMKSQIIKCKPDQNDQNTQIMNIIKSKLVHHSQINIPPSKIIFVPKKKLQNKNNRSLDIDFPNVKIFHQHINHEFNYISNEVIKLKVDLNQRSEIQKLSADRTSKIELKKKAESNRNDSRIQQKQLKYFEDKEFQELKRYINKQRMKSSLLYENPHQQYKSNFMAVSQKNKKNSVLFPKI